jgi:hypothetical protein
MNQSAKINNWRAKLRTLADDIKLQRSILYIPGCATAICKYFQILHTNGIASQALMLVYLEQG